MMARTSRVSSTAFLMEWKRCRSGSYPGAQIALTPFRPLSVPSGYKRFVLAVWRWGDPAAGADTSLNHALADSFRRAGFPQGVRCGRSPARRACFRELRNEFFRFLIMIFSPAFTEYVTNFFSFMLRLGADLGIGTAWIDGRSMQSPSSTRMNALFVEFFRAKC